MTPTCGGCFTGTVRPARPREGAQITVQSFPKIASAIAAAPSTHTAAKRFYRPELDALRFFAFLGVLLHHGPLGFGILWLISAAGGFGLSMFFLLSAYLITELLLREREKTATIAWRLFFLRRALRIWPLYYAALAAAIVIARISPHHYWISRTAIAVLALFVANWTSLAPGLGVFVGHLWSISIEEQFYLIWPPIIKLGGKRLAFIASIVFVVSAAVWLWVFSGKGWLLWYDTPVEFLFFAAGALIALVTRGQPLHGLRGVMRGGLLVAGLISLVLTAYFGFVPTEFLPGITPIRLCIKYAGAVVGCGTIFVAVLGMSRIPRVLIYFGKISYGLYVFHLAMLQLSMRLAAPFRLASYSATNVFLVDSLALLLCLFAAHLSYRYFERPFMRLKERFAVIQSRPA